MNKMAPKSTRATVASKGQLLYCENDEAVLKTQSKVFEAAGYAVTRVVGRAAAQETIRTGQFDVVVLGHTLSKDDRHHLPYMAKKATDTPVLVLHASGKHPAVDYAMDSRQGDEAVLKAIRSLVNAKSLAVAV